MVRAPDHKHAEIYRDPQMFPRSIGVLLSAVNSLADLEVFASGERSWNIDSSLSRVLDRHLVHWRRQSGGFSNKQG